MIIFNVLMKVTRCFQNEFLVYFCKFCKYIIKYFCITFKLYSEEVKCVLTKYKFFKKDLFLK